MCLKLKCFGYSCKKAWRGEGREKEKARVVFVFVFVLFFFFVVFFGEGGGQVRRRAGEEYFEASEKFECLGSRKISPQKVLYHYSCSSSKICSQCPYSHSLIQWRN